MKMEIKVYFLKMQPFQNMQYILLKHIPLSNHSVLPLKIYVVFYVYPLPCQSPANFIVNAQRICHLFLTAVTALLITFTRICVP